MSERAVPVHVTPRGVLYVNPADILASEKGKAGLKATTALFRRLLPPREPESKP